MGQNTHNSHGDCQYWCFISYKHADNQDQDREWASWLHQEIERYEVPAELVGTKNKYGDTIPERIYPVFRDEESLSADAELASSIVNALNRSRFMIVLCSPRACQSEYVAQEIRHFKEAGKGSKIIAAILAGEPSSSQFECFPKPLRHPIGDNGSLITSVTEEPIAADFRLRDGNEGYTSAESYRLDLSKDKNLSKGELGKLAQEYEDRLHLMKLKIIAGILGVPLEVLRNRDKFYQLQLARKRARTLRRWLTAVGVLFVIATIAGVIAIEQRSEAIDQRNTAWRNQSLFLADSSHQQVLDDTELAVLLALEGLPKSEQDDRPLIPEAEDTLFWAVLSLSKPERIEKSVQAVMFDSAGEMITIDGFEIESSGENMKFEYDYAITANSNGIVRTWKNGFEGRNIQITTKKQSFLEINIDEVNAQLESAILRWDNKAMLVAGGEDGDITFTHDVSLSSSAWHADSHLLATGTENGVVRIWNTDVSRSDSQKSPIHEFETSGVGGSYGINPGAVDSVAFNKDGTKLVTVSGQYVIEVWETATAVNLGSFTSDDGSFLVEEVLSAAFAENGQILTHHQSIATLRELDGTVIDRFEFDFVPDIGKELSLHIEPSQDRESGQIWIVNSPNGSVLARLNHDLFYRNEWTAAGFSRDGREIVAYANDGRAFYYRMPPKGEKLRKLARKLLGGRLLTKSEKCRFFLVNDC